MAGTIDCIKRQFNSIEHFKENKMIFTKVFLSYGYGHFREILTLLHLTILTAFNSQHFFCKFQVSKS